jgi:ATPase subunit of ABC transporter with duplicated ATPase domains
MKKFSLFILVLFLITAASSFQQINAQDKEKEEQDVKIQKSIDEQKKAISDQKKAKAEAEQTQQEELENSLHEAKIQFDDADGQRIMRLPRADRSYNFDVFSGNDMQGYFGHAMGDAERTTWDFSKTVKDNTFSTNYSFDVEKSSKSVVMSVMGDCKSGEIRIKIIMPNGKNYSDILIDESGNLNWRKSFMISETENQDKTGDWKFQISSAKATGFFKISLQAY